MKHALALTLAKSSYVPIYPLDIVGGVAPAVAYSTAKLRVAYTGPSIRILRPSDSAQLDIGFVGTKLDTVALSTFLGAQIGRVVKWYDQSGNGNDTVTNAVDAERAAIGYTAADNMFGGHRPMYFADGIQTLPAVAWDRRAISAYAVVQDDQGLEGIWQIGTASDPWQFALGADLWNVSPALKTQWRPLVWEFLCTPTAVIQGFGTETRSAAAYSVGAETGGYIGFADSGFKFSGWGTAWVAYARVLSDSDRALCKAALDSIFRTATVPGRVIFVGDSITVGSDADAFWGFSRLCQSMLSKRTATYMGAGGGNTLASQVTGYATGRVHAILTTYADTRVVFLHMGTNDITIAGADAATLYANIQSYCASVRADGGKIIVSTILPINDPAPQQAVRTSVNASLIANWASFADGLCDFTADPALATNTTTYFAGVHPKNTGHVVMAPYAAAAINALL